MSNVLNDYVVDASVIIQHLVTDVHTSYADVLFDKLDETAAFHIPEFCLLECVNVLWKRVRFHGLSKDIAVELVNNLIALPLTIIPASTLYKRGLQIGITHELAVYDAIYIALAEHLKTPLITDDGKQAKAAEGEGVTVIPITDFYV